MHEVGIANSIIETILQTMKEKGYARVTTIGLRIGALTDLVPDALEFGFEVMTRGTPLADARLAIEAVPVHGECRSCGKTFDVDQFIFVCPHCSGRDIRMTSGDELEIAYIEVDDEV